MDLISMILFPVMLTVAGFMLLRNRSHVTTRPEPVRVAARRPGRIRRRR